MDWPRTPRSIRTIRAIGLPSRWFNLPARNLERSRLVCNMERSPVYRPGRNNLGHRQDFNPGFNLVRNPPGYRLGCRDFSRD